MSNSIWKMPDQEQERNEEVLIEYIGVIGRPFYIFDEYVRRVPNQKRWCYITDLVAQADKAERLQKAVDYALDTLKKAETTRELTVKGHYVHAISLDELHSALKEIKQLIKENQ